MFSLCIFLYLITCSLVFLWWEDSSSFYCTSFLSIYSFVVSYKKKKKKTKLTTSNQSKNLIQTNLHRFFIANLDHHHPLSSSSIYISFASQFINNHTLKSLQSLQKMLTNFCKSNNMLIGYFRHNYYPKDVKRMTIAI